MSKFDQIETFILVVRTNGFAAAARKKGVSTAAISRQVHSLENDLGVKLIERTTRQMSLTPIGQQYFAHCKQVIEGLEEAEGIINQSKHEAIGKLHVTANRYFAINYLIPKFNPFLKANPKLNLVLELAEKHPDFDRNQMDVLFGVSVDGSLDLVRKRILDTRYILCASPKYLKKFGTPQKPVDLTDHHYITHSQRKPDNIIHFKNNQQIQVMPKLWMNDAQAICECAKQGLGIVQLHDYMVLDDIAKGNLIELLPDFALNIQPVYLYYRQDQYLLPKIRKFIDYFSL